jgi:acyl-CoA reductase-like NAD-dependent aldehyde dehydrogenase
MAAMPAHKRAAILMAVVARMRENREKLIHLLNRENGKTFREIDGWEIDAAARIIEGYAEEAKRLHGETVPLHGIPNLENSIAMTIYQPLGVIAAIVPFNYPVELWSHKIAGGLAAGNAVITKPPEECPLTILEVSSLAATTPPSSAPTSIPRPRRRPWSPAALPAGTARFAAR